MFSSLTRYLYTICLLMTAGITPLLAASPLHYEAQPVTHLEVIVVTSQADSNSEAAAIVTRMKTREGEFFSQANLDADLKALSLSYDRIEPSLQADAEGLKITLKVWPKPTIRALIWEGNEREDSSTLRSQLGINVYTAFDRQAFNTAFHKLQAYYFKHGYFEAELNYTINYDPLTNEVDITIKICEGRAGYIQEIIFRNFEKCDEDAILELMSTKQYNFFTSWMTQQGSFMPEAIERDQIGIVHYLQDKGYADASVNITVEEIPERHRINVIITAQLGERYRFGEITFEGNKLFDDATIHKALNLKADAPYSPELLREMIYFLTNLYGKRGYIEAYVNYEARLRPDSNIYDIHITIEEDKQYYVGMIQIFGNSVTQSRVILHEVLMLPGQVFNQEKLRKTEERLLNIGYFKSVNVYAARSDGNSFLPDNYRDIHIEVEETTTGNIGLSLAYSTVESMFGEVKLTERNFSYQGLTTLFSNGLGSLRGGGEYANLSFTLGTKTRRYALSWTKPFFMDTVWSIGFDIERSSSRYISDEYDIEATHFLLHAGYEMNAFMRFDCHYRFSNSHIPDGYKEKEQDSSIDGTVSAIGVTWIYDSTNAPVEPTEGFKSKADFEVAGLGGRHRFLKFTYLNSYYVPVGETGVLQVRADFKFIEPYGRSKPDSIPLDERFFLGGEETVRGYRPFSLGPKYKHDGNAPRGGISLQFYSIEYSLPVLSRAELFTFVDAGQLSLHRFHFGGLNVSAGYGGRFKVLPGAPPLTVGMGYPLNAKCNSDVKRFFITVGGRF